MTGDGDGTGDVDDDDNDEEEEELGKARTTKRTPLNYSDNCSSLVMLALTVTRRRE